MNSPVSTGTAEGGGLLVIEVDDLFLDAASGRLRLPLLVLTDEGDVGARL
jgi:hypothetical protein